MIIETDKTVFGCNADAIVNTVNCVGFMGKGLALEFALRYPGLKEAYVFDCKAKKVHTGKVNVYRVDGATIINFPTKFHFKYPSEIQWIKEGLDDFLSIYQGLGIKSVAFPLLGASNGGLNPSEVLALMKERLSKTDLEVFICHSKTPDELEKKMLSKFNATPIETIAANVRLTSSQRESLLKAQHHISRFYEIGGCSKIGNATYQALFDYFKMDGAAKERPEQLTLF